MSDWRASLTALRRSALVNPADGDRVRATGTSHSARAPTISAAAATPANCRTRPLPARDAVPTLYLSPSRCRRHAGGKSSLIEILTGAVARDGGACEVGGTEIGSHPSPVEARDAGVGAVYQELSLLPDLSVLDNLTMGRFPRTFFGVVNRAAQRRAATEHLKRVGLADLDLDQPVWSLPTATRQLVEIARVLSSDAKLVIFDEPTTALSEKESQALLDRIAVLRDAGHAVLYVTHRLEEMFAVGDRVTVLRDGRVVETRPMGEYGHDSLIQSMVGRPSRTSTRASGTRSAPHGWRSANCAFRGSPPRST